MTAVAVRPASPTVVAARAGPNVAAALLRGYRVGMVVVIAAVELFNLTSALRGAIPMHPVEWAYLIATVLLLVWGLVQAAGRWAPSMGVGAGVAVLLLAGDGLIATALGTAAIDTGRDWTLGLVGWLVFLAMAGLSRRLYVGLLLVPFLVRTVVLFVHGAGAESYATIGALSVGILVLQVGAGLFLAATREEAVAAQQAYDVRSRLNTERAVAEQLLNDFRARSAAMVDTTVPLLRELADGHCSAQDDHTRRRARVEAARLRRLFAEADVTDDTFLAEVRAVIAEVERDGVSATLDCSAAPPALPVDAQRALLDATMATLALARTTARVVIQQQGAGLVVSVTTDGSPPPKSARFAADPAVQTHIDDVENATWTQSTWTPAPVQALVTR